MIERRWLLIDHLGGMKFVSAKTGRQAVISAYALSRSPSIKRMMRSRRFSGKATHVGFVVGQGRGSPPIWVEVSLLTPVGMVSSSDENDQA